MRSVRRLKNMPNKTKLTLKYLVIVILFILLAYLKPTVSGALGLISSQLLEIISNKYIKTLIFILAADTLPLLIIANLFLLLTHKLFYLKNNTLLYVVLIFSSLSHLQFVLSPEMTVIGRTLLISLCSIMCFIIWYAWSIKLVKNEIKNT